MLEYGYIILEYLDGSSPPNFMGGGGDLKISEQNNWGEGPEQKIQFRGELNFRGGGGGGAYKPQ